MNTIVLCATLSDPIVLYKFLKETFYLCFGGKGSFAIRVCFNIQFPNKSGTLPFFDFLLIRLSIRLSYPFIRVFYKTVLYLYIPGISIPCIFSVSICLYLHTFTSNEHTTQTHINIQVHIYLPAYVITHTHTHIDDCI